MNDASSMFQPSLRDLTDGLAIDPALEVLGYFRLVPTGPKHCTHWHRRVSQKERVFNADF